MIQPPPRYCTRDLAEKKKLVILRNSDDPPLATRKMTIFCPLFGFQPYNTIPNTPCSVLEPQDTLLKDRKR